MIYRKWSLLTATVVFTGAAFASVVAADLLFVNDPYLKPKPKKQDATPSKQVE